MRRADAASWSSQQLTELLALVTSVPADSDVVQRAVEHAVESLEGDVGAAVSAGALVASVGYAVDEVPVEEILAAARGESATLDVPGAGVCRLLIVDCDGLPAGRLLLGRSHPSGFSGEERSLFRGFARVLSLALQARQTLEHERAQRVASQREAVHRQRLLDATRERQALLERLSWVQRSISARRPLREVLDAIVLGVTELVGEEIVELWLVDPDDASMLRLAAASGPSAHTVAQERRRARGEGIGGLSITRGALVVADGGRGPDQPLADYLGEGVDASMAAPVRQGDEVVGSLVVATRHPGRVYSASEQDTLVAFAEHTGLALNDAKTVAALHRAVSDARQQARRDPLTNLPNRTDFLEKLKEARAAGRPISLLFIDLDDFKLVNDTLGHPTGDELLRVVGERIVGTVRGDDVVARLGGDEFAVLLCSTPPDQAKGAAERIGQSLSRPFHVLGYEVSVGASTGVVLCTEPSQDSPEELLRDADVAMYRAKELGRGRAMVFVPSMRMDLQARGRLERDLRTAVDRGELVMHYQPVVDVARGVVVGSEALLRWEQPDLGPISPTEFIPVAEDIGLILAIGHQTLVEATTQTAAWNALPGARPLTVSVNVSGRQLMDGAIVDHVRDALRRSELPARALTLELTESVLVRDIDAAAEVMSELKALGVGLAIDDFGTGYCSLSYLSRLPLDVLKVDKAFVADIEHGSAEPSLAAAVVAIANSLHLDTVVEGIETLAQMRAMWRLGCTHFQGYLWSPPVKAPAFAAQVSAIAAAHRMAPPPREGPAGLSLAL